VLQKNTPKRGLRIGQDWQFGRYLPGIGIELGHLALMDMFGLLAIEHGPAAEGEAWRPAEIRRTAWGDAIFGIFQAPEALTGLAEEADEGPVVFGRPQGLFGPFFPEWQKNLALPTPASRKGVFVFDVSLGKTRRLIALSARKTLDDLAAGIVDAFDFDMDHLYSFTYTDRFGAAAKVLHPYCEQPPSTAQVRLSDLPLAEGEAMEFLYDFGDNWQFAVRLTRVDPPQRGFDRPVVLESRGKAPPQYPDPDEE